MTSALLLLFEADAWDSLISFEPGIPVELGGVLELTFAGDVDLATQVGRTLRLFDWTGVSPSGQFEIASPYVWDVRNLYTTGSSRCWNRFAHRSCSSARRRLPPVVARHVRTEKERKRYQVL